MLRCHCFYRRFVAKRHSTREISLTATFSDYTTLSQFLLLRKIEKVPRGIRGEKSSKDMADHSRAILLKDI